MEMSTPGATRATSSMQTLQSGTVPTRMVAVPGGIAAHQVSGSGGAAALTLPAVSLRKATTAQFVQWNVAFNNIVGMHNLTEVVAEGGPPTRKAILGLDNTFSSKEVDERYDEALREYQDENTRLFYLFAPSINIDGEWSTIDMEYILETFTLGTVRDGNGYLQWFRAKHDITAPEKQIRLRAELQSLKFDINMTLTRMLKTFVDALSIWCKIGDNDKNDIVKLNAYYVLMLEKMPTRPPESNLVRVRVRLAEQVYASAPQLSKVQETIEDLVGFGKALGMNDARDRDTVLTTTTTGGLPRLTAADNDCTYCDLFGCKAKTDIKACPCLNAAVKIGDGTNFARDMQCRYITGARAHLKDNPELKSLKSVKFHVEPPAGGYNRTDGRGGKGKGKGAGGRGQNGGRGGAPRQATPVITSVSQMLGDDDEDFDSWLAGQMHEETRVAAPIFGSLFGGDDSDDGTISATVRDAIADATTSAVDAAIASMTPGANAAATATPNPALVRLPPVTPVVNSALTELRAANSGANSGAIGTGGGSTTKATAKKSKSTEDDDKTSTEIVMEAGAKGLRQDRLLRQKAKKSQTSVKELIVAALKKLVMMIYEKASEYTLSQIAATLVISYYVVWPNLKPEVRNILVRMHSRLVVARDVFLSKVASRLIGITTTGVLLSMRSTITGGNNDDRGGNDTTGGSNTDQVHNPRSLNPRPISPASISLPSVPTAHHTRDDEVDNSRDSSPLSPIVESPTKTDTLASSTSSTSLKPVSSSDVSSDDTGAGVNPKAATAAATFAAVRNEVGTFKQVEANREFGDPCCPRHAGLPANVCIRRCGRVWCSACVASLGIEECDICNADACSEKPFCADADKWAPGNIECALELNEIGDANLVGVHSRQISEFAIKEGMVMINSSLIPQSAVLFDNGATLNCAKNAAGRLVGSFIENAEGDINVGDAGSNLHSDGSFLHALEYIDSDGKSVDTLYRYDDTPNVICNILSEAIEVYENGGSFLFNVSSGRTWTTSSGLDMKLHMTKNGLGWCKAMPIHDAARIQALLRLKKINLVASIPRSIAMCSVNMNSLTVFDGMVDGSSPGLSSPSTTVTPDNPKGSASTLTTAIGESLSDVSPSPAASSIPQEMPTEIETTVDMDSLATSIDMLHIIDPTFTTTSLDVTSAVEPSASTPPTVAMNSSSDENVTYLTHALEILATDDAPPFNGKRQAFTIEVDDHYKILSSSELADRLADFKMAAQRTCTSYAKPLDESMACDNGRVEQMLARLDKITKGKACEMVADRFNTLRAAYPNETWSRLVRERDLYLTKINSKTKPFQSWERYGCTTSHSTCNDWKCMARERDEWLSTQTSVDGSKNLINRDLSNVPLTASGPPCELCGWSSIASWRVPAACLVCGMRLCEACHKLHNCVELEATTHRIAAAIESPPPQPPSSICAGCAGTYDDVGTLKQCELCAELWCDACFDNDVKHWLRCKPDIERGVCTTVDDHVSKLLNIVAATTKAAPPNAIGMGRPVPLTGIEILTRLHVVLGHPPLDQLLATLAKTQNMRANVVTKSDVEEYIKRGCIQCIIWKMRRSPVKSLTDATRAPIGKKWSYDTLSLKVKTVGGNWYLTRFLDDGSNKKRTYGHSDFTALTLAKVLAIHRAWVRPLHGEIWVGRRDGHPSQRSQLFQDALIDGQTHDESTAPYRHEAMPVEVTWQHDVPGAMILLSTGPGSKYLRHFEAAFLCHEDANNRVVKPRTHDGEAVSADMLYFGDTTAHANLLYAFWAPVMYLVYPEIRSSKFNEHAHPGAYYGPSRETESDRYCSVWNGHRVITCDKGCIRIDERQVISMSSRTNKIAQPFTLSPDARANLPSFDQWVDPAREKPESQQLEPSIEDVELDPDITLSDPDPSTPFILFLHAGRRRIGEIGHYVRLLTKSRVRVVSIDPKRCGYSHNILIPRVYAWVRRLALLVLCIAVIISGPCSPWTPLAMEKATDGRSVLFDVDRPDGIKAPDGSPHPLVESALLLHKLGFDVARDVHRGGGKVLIEHPVGHGAHSMWPIRGREKHSTLFDTTIFKDLMKDVPGDLVYTDQCMLGAPTRKSTQWWCNDNMFKGAFKYLSVQCSEENTEDHPYPHTTSLVGKNDRGEWRSKGSDEYKPPLCRAAALAVLHEYTFNASSNDAPTTEHTTGGGYDAQNSTNDDDGSDNKNSDDDCDDHGDDIGDGENGDVVDDPVDDPDTPDNAYIALESSVEQARTSVEEGGSTSIINDTEIAPALTLAPTISDPPDPFPAGSKVDVFWTSPKQWYTGTITSTSVWRGAKGLSRNPRRHISITYDIDGEELVHSLHETQVRLAQVEEESHMPSLSPLSNAPPLEPQAPSLPPMPIAPSPRDDAAPGSPRPRPSTPVPRPETPPRPTPSTNNPSTENPSFLPSNYKLLKEGSLGFVHHGEKVIALPDDTHQPYQSSDDIQARQGDIGTSNMVSSTMKNTKKAMTSIGRYSECMRKMHDSHIFDSDLVSFVSHEVDVELGTTINRRIVSAVLCGEEVSIDPDEPKQWHTPKNERDYLRSPQRAMWRTAKEKKMDQYLGLKVFKLVRRADVKSRIMGSLWAYKIKFNELGKFEKLNPRWCVKGYHMDKSIYVGFSEVCMTSSIKLMAAMLATYALHSFLFDCGNAFQATRTDNGTVRSEKLHCEQAPGFNVKDDDGSSMVCEILVALQGRVDAARLFGDRLEQIIFKLGGKRSTWDPKVYIFHFGPLTGTSASLDKVLDACAKEPNGNDKNGAPYGWATMAVHVDDCPGIGSSSRIIDYIKSGIMLQYECTHGPWKKVLGFNFKIANDSVSMSAEHTIEAMYNTYLSRLPLHDARLPGRDVKLTKGEIPEINDPRYTSYLEMQTETRSLLGLLLWVSLAYPQISFQVNKACGFMSNPSHDVNAYAKHIAMHLYQHPVPVTWGGGRNLELSQPSPPPFTQGTKEYGLHFAADAAPDDSARGITGGVGMFNGGVIITVSSRQHLASPDMHAYEVLAAGTIMHKIVPIRGLLTEWRIPQEHPTPLYIDSASTVFVAQSRGAVKKSAWIRRRAEVLQEAFDLGECDPRKIEEYNNISDPQTKYLVYKVWMRHLHYTHNLEGEPPPPVDKVSRSKGPSTTAVLTKKEKQEFLLHIGL